VVGSLFRLDGVRCARQDGVHCGVHGLHCVVRGTSKQWPPMPSDTERVLPVRLCGIMGASVHIGPATPTVGPAQGLTSARRLGLVGGGDYSCEWVVVAEPETCRANGLS
jgi:hypothetical protein